MKRARLVVLLALLVAGVASAQTDPGAAQRELLQKRNSMLGVIDAIERTQKDLEGLQAELESDRGRGREIEIVQQIQALGSRLAELQRNFSEISAGVDPRIFDQEVEEQVDFSKEVRDLLGPLIHEIRRMTSRPREIDRLRSEISDLADQLLVVDRAVANVKQLEERIQEPVILEELRSERLDWQKRRQSVQTALSVARQKLEQKENERTSITETVQSVFQLFFKSRGRNLLLALFATVVFLLFLRRLHQELQKRGPLGKPSPSFRARLFDLAYAVFTVLGSVLVFLIVLYVFGDWVLLILVILLIMGLIWASKQALPAFWTQATLLLNMGVVREGERLVYHGIPFEVESLGFYTQLVNPMLTAGRLRLPINDLTALRSRPFDASEPWFPTREGDWVLLPDGGLARIVYQSLEGVRVVRKGGASQVFPTADFPALVPVVLSDGFRISVTFGVDYEHVEIVTEEVVERLHGFVSDALGASPFRGLVRKVAVEFESAGASSLDLALLCDFSGEAAARYDELTRLLNRLAVDACNAFGWVIPFQQVTLHMATEAGERDHPIEEGGPGGG